jgi:uncharacterized protein
MSELARLTRLLDESGDPDNPSADALRDLLSRVRRIGVVGLSREPTKPSRRVPSYLAAKGFEVIPVNPFADRILGRPAHAHLDEVTEPLDLVLVFRPSHEAGSVIEDAARRPERPAIWLQEGILAPEATRTAREAGLEVVQDLCIFKVHRFLPANRPPPPPTLEDLSARGGEASPPHRLS